MGTFILCQRRHPSEVLAVIQSLLEILDFNRNLVTLLLSHSQPNETSVLMIELLNEGERASKLSEVFGMFKFW